MANGDIHEWQHVDEVLEQTKADGVLIARGALGNPWFFSQYLKQDGTISAEERVQRVVQHAKLHMKHHGWVAPKFIKKQKTYWRAPI
mgnify:CR=1 FL=1